MGEGGQDLHLHCWIYAIHDGLLRDLGPHLSSVAERDALLSIDQRVQTPSEPISAMRHQAMAAFAALATKTIDGHTAPRASGNDCPTCEENL